MTKRDELVAGLGPADRLEYEQALLRYTTADQLSSYLEDTGVRQADVAERTGKSPAWISKALSGSQNLTLDSLAHLAWAIGLTWELQLRPAHRQGTPAIHDAPVPSSWIGGHQASTYTRPVVFGQIRHHQHQARAMETWVMMLEADKIINVYSSTASADFIYSGGEVFTNKLITGRKCTSEVSA